MHQHRTHIIRAAIRGGIKTYCGRTGTTTSERYEWTDPEGETFEAVPMVEESAPDCRACLRYFAIGHQ